MIVVVMTCYAPVKAREHYAHETLSALIRYVKCTSEQVRLHVADDGSPDKDYIQSLMNRSCRAWGTQPSFSDAERHGIGASLNRAMEWVENGDLFFYITDDWCLTRHLYLDRAAAFIRRLNYDIVRLGPIHPNLACTTRFDSELGWWLDIHQSAGGYAFATRPFLASRRLIIKCGSFLENADAYDTERVYAEKVRDSDVRIASINMRGPWRHIGEYEVGKIQPRTADTGFMNVAGDF